jgi:hypothetical protein
MATYREWLDDDLAVAYLVAEEARFLCESGGDGTAAARVAFAEAAYHLSDPLAPDDRGDIVAAVAEHLGHSSGIGGASIEEDALVLATEAAANVEALLCGPNASSELHMALRALREGIRELATRIGVARAALLMLQDVAA